MMTILLIFFLLTDELFSSFYPEAPLPLSLIQGRPLHLEVRLLDPPDPDLVLLVQSCLAVSPAPRPTWIPIYDTYVCVQTDEVFFFFPSLILQTPVSAAPVGLTRVYFLPPTTSGGLQSPTSCSRLQKVPLTRPKENTPPPVTQRCLRFNTVD